jgi:two-component sensor histidine kinase
MTFSTSQTINGGADRPVGETQRLVFENARLHRLCMEAAGMAAQHELMLREADHRIKNSLQVVASLLHLQARRETNGVVREALQAARARIQTVACIHDALQLDSGTDSVDVGALIATMSKALHAMAGEPVSVEIIVRAEPVQLQLTLAQPIMLAVNELVINALRHAFPDGRNGAVMVTVARDDDRVRIYVCDNGIGLPDGYGDGRGYGTTLVHAMVAKIGGRLDVETSSGARFTLSAPVAEPAVLANAASNQPQAMAAR